MHLLMCSGSVRNCPSDSITRRSFLLLRLYCPVTIRFPILGFSLSMVWVLMRARTTLMRSALVVMSCISFLCCLDLALRWGRVGSSGCVVLIAACVAVLALASALNFLWVALLRCVLVVGVISFVLHIVRAVVYASSIMVVISVASWSTMVCAGVLLRCVRVWICLASRCSMAFQCGMISFSISF